jgi:hypothetical protein
VSFIDDFPYAEDLGFRVFVARLDDAGNLGGLAFCHPHNGEAPCAVGRDGAARGRGGVVAVDGETEAGVVGEDLERERTMTESIKFKVAATGGTNHRTLVGPTSQIAGSIRVTLELTMDQYNAIKDRDLDITIEPVQTREERLREARIAGLKEFWRTTSMSGSYDESKIIAVIERVDAEFAKGEK